MGNFFLMNPAKQSVLLEALYDCYLADFHADVKESGTVQGRLSEMAFLANSLVVKKLVFQFRIVAESKATADGSDDLVLANNEASVHLTIGDGPHRPERIVAFMIVFQAVWRGHHSFHQSYKNLRMKIFRIAAEAVRARVEFSARDEHDVDGLRPSHRDEVIERVHVGRS